MYTRRDFGKMALAALPVSALLGAPIDSTVNGVHLGASTYSFRDFPHAYGQDIVEPVIKALEFCGVGEIELYAPTIEPAGQKLPPEAPAPYGMPRPARAARSEEQAALEKANREALRSWRIGTPAAHFQAIRNKFESAGVRVFAYTVNYNDSYTDEEIDATFEQAKALGADNIASSMTLPMAEALRSWRIGTPAAHFQAIRNKFESAGVRVFAYTVNYNDSYTDEEIDATFEKAKAASISSS